LIFVNHIHFKYQEFASDFKTKNPTRESDTELGKLNLLLGMGESKVEYSKKSEKFSDTQDLSRVSPISATPLVLSGLCNSASSLEGEGHRSTEVGEDLKH
jgi:hypothetical protein